MSELAEDIAQWLAQAAGLAYGTDVFLGWLPEDGGTVSAVSATGGAGQADRPTGQATFQVITRAATPADCRLRAWTLYRTIHPADDSGRRRHNVHLSADWRAMSLEAIQYPAELGPDEGGRFLASFNILARIGARSA